MAKELIEEVFQFHSCQIGTKAKVASMTKHQIALGRRASDVEDFGVFEYPRVTYGRRVEHNDLLACWDLLTVELYVFGGRSVHACKRADVPNHFFDGRFVDGGVIDVVDKVLSLLGMFDQKFCPTRQNVSRCLAAADENQCVLKEKVVFVDFMTLKLCVELSRQDVIAGIRFAVFDSSIVVFGKVSERVIDFVVNVLRTATSFNHRIGPAADLGVIFA